MKVISIKQPWASLIINGYKIYEFRTWKTKYRGKLLIHSSKIPDKKAIERFKYLNLDYPTGVIIGEVNLSECLEVNKTLANELFKQDSNVYKNVLNHKGYAWKLEDIKKFEKYTFINGKLGLWEFNEGFKE